MVKVPARSILPMIVFRGVHCITHHPVIGTVSQRPERPEQSVACRITLRTPVGKWSDSKGTDITDTIAETKARVYFPNGHCHARQTPRPTTRPSANASAFVGFEAAASFMR
jgi:hypothetical protein